MWLARTLRYMPELNRRINTIPVSGALDEADQDASLITNILDEIPGAWERAQESIEQAQRDETMPLSEL